MTSRMLTALLALAMIGLPSSITGYGYEIIPGVRFMTGANALLLGGTSIGLFFISILAYIVDGEDDRDEKPF